MAVTVVGAGSWGVGNSGGNPVCTIPTVTGGILATDMLVVVVNAHKAAAQTETLPATHSTRPGMSLLASAEGNTQPTGTDTGPCLIGVYTETGASIAGDDGDTITTNIDGFTSGTSGTAAATRCFVLRRDDTSKPWSIAAATGADNTPGSPWSVTFGSNPGITSGDRLIVGNCLPTDTNPTYDASTVAADGATLGAPANTSSLSIAAGVDAGGRCFTVACTAGTATAAPTWSTTLSGTTTNAAGPAILARFREQGTTILAGDVAAEADTAVPGTGRKTAAGTVAGELDGAAAGAGLTSAGAAPAPEADSATAGTGRKLAAGTPAADLDTAVPGTGRRSLAGTPAGEADTATAGTGRKTGTGTPAADLDTAAAGAGRLLAAGTPAAEADTAVPGAGAKRAAGTPAAETDQALAGSGAEPVQAAPAREMDTATAGAGRVLAAGGVAGQIDTAVPGAGRKLAAGAVAREMDRAIGIGLAMTPAVPGYAAPTSTTAAAYTGSTTAAATGGTTTAGVRIR